MKSRLTITLSENTLNQIDSLIDSSTYRNRSHAIEHLLEQQLQPSISTAIILAGGEQDIRSLTPIDGKPLIIHQLEHLKKYSIDQVIIAANQQGRQLQKIIGTGEDFGLEIEYVFEKKPLGTAGAIKNAAQLVEQDRFVVMAGDVLTNINLTELAQFHLDNKALITMAVKPKMMRASYDAVLMQGNQVVDFKKSEPQQEVSIINTGVYIFEKSALNFIPKTATMLEQDVFPHLAQSHTILAFPFQGIWFDVTSETNHQQALKQLQS